MYDVENALERFRGVWGRLERTYGPFPEGARVELQKMVRRVVLDAAHLCDLRFRIDSRAMSARVEASKCASLVRHHLLCLPGQSVCLRCDGEGCGCCHQRGVREGG